MKDLSQRIEDIRQAINDAEYVVIGAGAGLSTAAGIEYGGERFQKYFAEYIDKYDMTDMYTAGFYPFKTLEEKWGYWSKHIYTNCVNMESTGLYEKLYDLVKDKNYFVITTNVDEQFVKSGFPSDKIFATQGSYNYFQCSNACHDKVYNNTTTIKDMVDSIDEDLKISTELIPYCPVCGEPMDTNLRKDNYFVEDQHWHLQNKAYKDFLDEAKHEKTVLLEFGIGYNTPSIIRFPFETMTLKISDWTLVRFNRSHLEVATQYNGVLKLVPLEMLEKYPIVNNFLERYIPVSENIETVIDELLR